MILTAAVVLATAYGVSGNIKAFKTQKDARIMIDEAIDRYNNIDEKIHYKIYLLNRCLTIIKKIKKNFKILNKIHYNKIRIKIRIKIIHNMSKIIKFSIKINKIMDINGRKIIIYIKIFLKSYNNNKIKKC